jgi:hypothetical protein
MRTKNETKIFYNKHRFNAGVKKQRADINS